MARMRGRFFLAAGLTVLFAATTPAHAAGPCSLPHMHVLRQSSIARVFSVPVKGHGDATRRIYGCLRSQRPQKLATDFVGRTFEYSQTNSMFRLGDSTVAWVHDDDDTEDGHTFSIE